MDYSLSPFLLPSGVTSNQKMQATPPTPHPHPIYQFSFALPYLPKSPSPPLRSYFLPPCLLVSLTPDSAKSSKRICTKISNVPALTLGNSAVPWEQSAKLPSCPWATRSCSYLCVRWPVASSVSPSLPRLCLCDRLLGEDFLNAAACQDLRAQDTAQKMWSYYGHISGPSNHLISNRIPSAKENTKTKGLELDTVNWGKPDVNLGMWFSSPSPFLCLGDN